MVYISMRCRTGKLRATRKRQHYSILEVKLARKESTNRHCTKTLQIGLVQETESERAVGESKLDEGPVAHVHGGGDGRVRLAQGLGAGSATQ